MRCAKRDDVGGRNSLRRSLNLTGPLNYEDMKQVLASCRPYGGLTYFHLLLDRLAEAGYVT